VIEGGGSVISGFAVGVLDKGGNTAGDAIVTTDNGVGLEMNGTGESTTEIWTNVDSTANSKQGIYIYNCGDECGISDFSASGNGADGVLVTGSDGPRISVFTATGNGGAGVHVGCTWGCGSNSEVKVGDAPEGATAGSAAVTGNNGDGIFLDASESTNMDQVYLISASGNGVTSGHDLHDASSTCGGNHWVTNDYGTADADGVLSPACIPLTPF
jgi:parallel beta-helix repeat protein